MNSQLELITFNTFATLGTLPHAERWINSCRTK